MEFELMLYGIIVLTLFLSMITVLLAGGDKDQEVTSFIVAVLFLWAIVNGLAFLVYLGVSVLH